MADKFLDVIAGKITQVEATDTSTGVAEAGDIVALGPDGRIDPSLLPTGVGADASTFEAAEALSAGDYVNIFDDGGTTKIRLADSTNGRDAHGFITTSIAAAATGTVFFEGENGQLTGLTPGSRYYLTSAGDVTLTPPSTPTDTISQFLGIAISATAINTDIDDCILLA